MWNYTKKEKYYIITYHKDDGESFCFTLPIKQYFDDYTIMIWTDKKIQKFIKELNTGSISFEKPVWTNNQENIRVHITYKNKPYTNKVFKGRIEPL